MSVDLTDRSAANDVADWIERERAEARANGWWPEKRAYVQNIDLIVAALREYGAKSSNLAPAITSDEQPRSDAVIVP